MIEKLKALQNKPIVLLAIAAVLLLGSTVGSTQAALTYYSENYQADVTISNIGVTLLENNGTETKEVSKRNYLDNDQWDTTSPDAAKLFTGLLPEGEALVLGKDYIEKLSVKNSGAIDTYVRVILTKSWKDASGNKDATLSPELIELNLVTGANGWFIDENASTAERTVLYYNKVLGVGETTPEFTDILSISPLLQEDIVQTQTAATADGKTIAYEYKYDDYTFHVEAEVNAVQKNNAQDAIKSAWGIDVTTAEDGTLSLGKAPAEDTPDVPTDSTPDSTQEPPTDGGSEEPANSEPVE